MHIDREANALAQFLTARGVNPMARVGIEDDGTFEMAVAMRAVEQTGAKAIILDLTDDEFARRDHARSVGLDLVLTCDDALYDAPAVPAELFASFWN